MAKKLSPGNIFFVFQFTIILIYLMISHSFDYNRAFLVKPRRNEKEIICYNVSFPRINYSVYSWQTIVPSKSFVYSAFMDTRHQNPQIKVMAVIDNSYHGNSSFTCHIWEKTESHPYVTKAILVKKLGSGNFR